MPKLCVLFVRSESVLYERTQIDKVRPALHSFVRVHCFRSTASLQSFTQLVRDISKGSPRPSAIIDDSNAFAPVLPFGQFAPFSVAPTSGRTVIDDFASNCVGSVVSSPS